MKKKVLMVLVIMLVIGQKIFAFDFSAVAPSGQTLYYNITSGNTVTVTHPSLSSVEPYSGYTKPTGNLTIPSNVTYNGTTYSVTLIGGVAFYDCSGLTSVTIPNSVTSIGSVAFGDCNNLTSITIPNSITSIYNSAFWDCSGLTSVTIPNSVIMIGENAFRECSGLTSVTIPNSVTSIGYSAFCDCSGLTSVIFNADSCISAGLFSEYHYSEDFYSAFGGCNNLTNITFGNNVRCIPNYLCYGCRQLTTITIPNSVTSIGNHAFQNCRGLTSVTISSSVTSIGNHAFQNCNSLTSITIPSNVTLIAGCTFNGCSGLTSVIIPNSVITIDDSAFYGCSGLTSVAIGDSVTSIGNFAFADCCGLISVTIPNSVTLIGSGAFSYCTGLSFVIFNADSCIVNYSNYHVFGDCNNLRNITFGNNIRCIPNYLCSGCYGLTSITIPNSITTIGRGAFNNCDNLTNITFGRSVTAIGDSALNGCTDILRIHMLGSNPPTVQANTFHWVPSTAHLYVPCNATTAYENAAYWNQFNIAEEFSYSFSATTADQTKGMVQVIHAPECGNLQAEVQATPYNGFHFVQWSDGNTDAHRYLVVVQDTAIQAEFAEGSGTESIGDVDALNAKVYINDGQIVVDGAEGNPVSLYDINGRLLTTRRDDFFPLRFDAPASGAYMIKIGNHPARKVVVIR